ncbi:Y-family DNA polymerase [Alkalimarinus alittae]|uniref:Y-family DNA polymerase n=1 Tax=Alkalimarinus alittae TaxID=2961619 RepID=A0ABY6N683_9ALTE|nr:Y-family DNA polymerase [Alkalimarinus alittae]UZE97540.1 Y-family DNA polymerase [Alkalimarinus alittae]
MLALVDCNACYASCEQIFRPDLRGKPIVVLSNNDGCIVTRNAQAKALGVPGLVPYFKIKPLLEHHQVHIFSSNYELYGDISARLMGLLATLGDRIEIYSIDEAFLELNGFSDVISHGQLIKKLAWQHQRMPVCVGIAETKTLAKLANHIAKKSNKLNGVCRVSNLHKWENVFKKIAVDKVWGVGSRLAKRLNLFKIYSVHDLKRQPPKRIRKEFGVTLERTVLELNEVPCFDLETQPQPKKEVFCSRSFSKKITSKQAIKESVAHYANRAAEKLRQQNGLTKRIYVTIQTSRYSDHPYSNSVTLPLPYPTNDSRIIISTATEASDSLFREGYGYARAGVGLLELTNSKYYQNDFFQSDSERSVKLMTMIDQMNKRYGHGSVFFARQGIKRGWSMARSFKSPAYTTRISDLPVVKI